MNREPNGNGTARSTFGRSLTGGFYWHACETQLLPMHDLHVAPPVPHAELLVPATQLAPMQQPLGQETLSQIQVPPTQCLPVAQAGELPH